VKSHFKTKQRIFCKTHDVKNLILNFIGGVSLVFGIFGAFFTLASIDLLYIAGYKDFSQSSPTCHLWLYFRSPFSTSIQNWQQRRVIRKKAKLRALFSLALSFGLTAMFVMNDVLLVSLGIGIMFC